MKIEAFDDFILNNGQAYIVAAITTLKGPLRNLKKFLICQSKGKGIHPYNPLISYERHTKIGQKSLTPT